MSSKRLVVLDEEDYQDLLTQAKRRCSEEPLQPTHEPEPKQTETTLQPVKEAEPKEHPKEATPEPSRETSPATERPVEQEDVESVLPDILSSLPKSAQKSAQTLFDKLVKLDSFGVDLETGAISLNGEPLNNYNLQKLLLATCKKSASNTLPIPLRVYLRKNGFTKFRNPLIKLNLKGRWKSLHA